MVLEGDWTSLASGPGSVSSATRSILLSAYRQPLTDNRLRTDGPQLTGHPSPITHATQPEYTPGTNKASARTYYQRPTLPKTVGADILPLCRHLHTPQQSKARAYDSWERVRTIAIVLLSISNYPNPPRSKAKTPSNYLKVQKYKISILSGSYLPLPKPKSSKANKKNNTHTYAKTRNNRPHPYSARPRRNRRKLHRYHRQLPHSAYQPPTTALPLRRSRYIQPTRTEEPSAQGQPAELQNPVPNLTLVTLAPRIPPMQQGRHRHIRDRPQVRHHRTRQQRL